MTDVDPASLTAAGTALAGHGPPLADLGPHLQTLFSDIAAAAGEPSAAGAADNAAAYWAAMATGLGTAVGLLGRNVTAAAAVYQQTDRNVASAARGTGGRAVAQ
ncbi:MAG: hypothetical protein ACR2JQ_02625 [Mycobacteriales bacterium]